MRCWRVDDDAAAPVPVWLAIGLMAGIGSPELARHFLDTLQHQLPSSHCTVFSLDAADRAQTLSAASAYGEVAIDSANTYIRHDFDLQDPNLQWLARRRTPQAPQMWMSQLRAEDVPDTPYGRLCYAEHGVRERLSLLLLMPQGGRVAVSFYRTLASTGFNAADVQWFSRAAPLIMAALSVHLGMPALAGRKAQGVSLLDAVSSQLPRREREVLSHVLGGKTVAEIASLLDLSSTTILTYRYRAFAKLGVRTHRDLLALVRRGG